MPCLSRRSINPAFSAFAHDKLFSRCVLGYVLLLLSVWICSVCLQWFLFVLTKSLSIVFLHKAFAAKIEGSTLLITQNWSCTIWILQNTILDFFFYRFKWRMLEAVIALFLSRQHSSPNTNRIQKTGLMPADSFLHMISSDFWVSDRLGVYTGWTLISWLWVCMSDNQLWHFNE